MSDAFGFEGPSPEIRWPLLRVNAGQEVEVRLLSAAWFRVATHFSRRTLLCAGTEDCPLCGLLPSRSYYYLPAAGRQIKRRVLLELSPLAAADLEQNCRMLEGGFRPGLTVCFSRRSARAPMRSEVLGSGGSCDPVPHETWITAVMAVYGMPAVHAGESLADYGARTASRVIERANQQASVLRAGHAKSAKGRAG